MIFLFPPLNEDVLALTLRPNGLIMQMNTRGSLPDSAPSTEELRKEQVAVATKLAESSMTMERHLLISNLPQFTVFYGSNMVNFKLLK